MGNILEIRGLKVFYGVHEAVCGVDMDIAEGSITAIIGSNGAGKSTIINAISGAVKYEGEIFCRGAVLPTKENRVVRQGVVQVPEGRKIFPGLTVEENLRAGAYTIRGHKEIERLLQERMRCSRVWVSAASRTPARSPAASSRCWRSAAA